MTRREGLFPVGVSIEAILDTLRTPAPRKTIVRISADPNDPGFDERKARRASVTLDGQPVARCVTADEEAGLVVVRERIAGKLFETTRYGAVKIKLAEKSA